jgi:hypothetical protein
VLPIGQGVGISKITDIGHALGRRTSRPLDPGTTLSEIVSEALGIKEASHREAYLDKFSEERIHCTM